MKKIGAAFSIHFLFKDAALSERTELTSYLVFVVMQSLFLFPLQTAAHLIHQVVSSSLLMCDYIYVELKHLQVNLLIRL